MHALYNGGDWFVSIADVAYAATHTLSSAVLVLEIAFIGMKREGKNFMKQTSVPVVK